MAAKTLKNYLEKIDAGEAINLRAFQKLIASISSFDGFAESDLQSVKKDAHTYILSYINPEKLAFLHHYAESQGEDRVSGAMQNNSHAFKVNGSLLLIQKYQNHPDVLIFKLPSEIDIEEERCEQILSITLYEIAVDNMIENVQRYVWQKLQELLPNAGIIDFLYALEYFLSALDDACVSQRRNDRDRIDDGVYYLDYIIWDYAEASL